ncbi:MAG: YbaY family lipoprotein [Caulobacterales bacterium]|nr:YbaY family lipoprotein [Caulobacterales bacterium]
MRIAPIALPLALTLAACAPAGIAALPGSGQDTTQVTVTATYRERILLTPGHVLNVRLEDVSLMDAPSRVIVESSMTVDGRGPPYRVTFAVPRSQIQPQNTYVVRAEIRDPAGRLRFTTDTHYPVLTRGAPTSADIVMVAGG